MRGKPTSTYDQLHSRNIVPRIHFNLNCGRIFWNFQEHYGTIYVNDSTKRVNFGLE